MHALTAIYNRGSKTEVNKMLENLKRPVVEEEEEEDYYIFQGIIAREQRLPKGYLSLFSRVNTISLGYTPVLSNRIGEDYEEA